MGKAGNAFLGRGFCSIVTKPRYCCKREACLEKSTSDFALLKAKARYQQQALSGSKKSNQAHGSVSDKLKSKAAEGNRTLI